MPGIMIVDDAAFMRMTLKTMLEKNGFTVVAEAENGLVGCEKFGIYKPDLVTMDITMPEMDGISALKKIKSEHPQAKIIMVSAMGQENYVKDAIMSGAKGFIVKPFKEDYVVETVKKVLGT